MPNTIGFMAIPAVVASWLGVKCRPEWVELAARGSRQQHGRGLRRSPCAASRLCSSRASGLGRRLPSDSGGDSLPGLGSPCRPQPPTKRPVLSGEKDGRISRASLHQAHARGQQYVRGRKAKSPSVIRSCTKSRATIPPARAGRVAIPELCRVPSRRSETGPQYPPPQPGQPPVSA